MNRQDKAAARPVGDSGQTLRIDLACDTGPFRGGASGTLYGLGDDGVPTQSLLNGAAITNTSQKAPFGQQHPSGDALAVESSFFAAAGQDLYVYMQDFYPDWPYTSGTRPGDERTYDPTTGDYTNEANGGWDYLEVVRFVVDSVATKSAYPRDYVFVPFNEPDGTNWYPHWPDQRDQFLADWAAIVETIRHEWERYGLGRPRIGGPGDTKWEPERTRDFLTYTRDHHCLPDVFIWHELGIENLPEYRSHFDEYRALERELGIDPIPLNITEYGMLRDMGTPGRLIQWFARFEDTKVDAQTAFWNQAGNLSDNTARANAANGGWWMFAWYGDLVGSRTVAVIPPTSDEAESLQGICAIDGGRATVLFGGADGTVVLDIANLDPGVFGEHVDVEVREVRLTGARGPSSGPRVVLASQVAVGADRTTQIRIPGCDADAGYQALITPRQSRDLMRDLECQPWVASVEAECTQLSAASIRICDRRDGQGWTFLASGGADVVGFHEPASRADWAVDIPHDGLYRFEVLGATLDRPGCHALFVDDRFSAYIEYGADFVSTTDPVTTRALRGRYRGSTEAVVHLDAGPHTLSLRTSLDGVTLLSHADISLDRFTLTDVTGGELRTYPATTFRLGRGARLDWSCPGRRGSALVGSGQSVTSYATVHASGYYDVRIELSVLARTSGGLRINGTELAPIEVPGEGDWVYATRVYLPEGITEVCLQSAQDTHIHGYTVSRAGDADASTVVIDLATVAFADVVDDPGQPEYAIGRHCPTPRANRWRAASFRLPRSTGFDQPGLYAMTIRYANGAHAGSHQYNAQTVNLPLAVMEAGETRAATALGPTGSWDSFLEHTLVVDLQTGDAAVEILSPGGCPPAIQAVSISPLVVSAQCTETIRLGELT